MWGRLLKVKGFIYFVCIFGLWLFDLYTFVCVLHHWKETLFLAVDHQGVSAVGLTTEGAFRFLLEYIITFLSFIQMQKAGSGGGWDALVVGPSVYYTPLSWAA